MWDVKRRNHFGKQSGGFFKRDVCISHETQYFHVRYEPERNEGKHGPAQNSFADVLGRAHRDAEHRGSHPGTGRGTPTRRSKDTTTGQGTPGSSTARDLCPRAAIQNTAAGGHRCCRITGYAGERAGGGGSPQRKGILRVLLADHRPFKTRPASGTVAPLPLQRLCRCREGAGPQKVTGTRGRLRAAGDTKLS